MRNFGGWVGLYSSEVQITKQNTLHEELRRSLASFGSVMMISFEV
jgi:hypothetical protein